MQLEPNPELQGKYLDLIDSTMSLTDNERQQYEREFPQEQQIMATLTERWKAEGIRQGMQQGIQQGMEQGIQQGLAQGVQEGRCQMLARMLEKRFGTLDVKILEHLKAASTTELDHWAERILDAETLDEVFRVH